MSQLYRVTTGNACFGIVVANGRVVRAAPIAGAAMGRQWSVVQSWYPKRAIELVPQAGWEIQEGAGGWRCVNKARLWSTNVHPSPAKAMEAAEEIERAAALHQEEQQRLCANLRKCFAGI